MFHCNHDERFNALNDYYPVSLSIYLLHYVHLHDAVVIDVYDDAVHSCYDQVFP